MGSRAFWNPEIWSRRDKEKAELTLPQRKESIELSPAGHIVALSSTALTQKLPERSWRDWTRCIIIAASTARNIGARWSHHRTRRDRVSVAIIGASLAESCSFYPGTCDSWPLELCIRACDRQCEQPVKTVRGRMRSGVAHGR